MERICNWLVLAIPLNPLLIQLESVDSSNSVERVFLSSFQGILKIKPRHLMCL